jgi:hypothetical protein
MAILRPGFQAKMAECHRMMGEHRFTSHRLYTFEQLCSFARNQRAA